VEGQRLGEIRPGDPHLATGLAMGTANSLLRWFTPAGPISAQELMSATVEYMLAGLGPQGLTHGVFGRDAVGSSPVKPIRMSLPRQLPSKVGVLC
jgi:Tetracyclin repressor-like, C-terminal domain